MTNLIKMNFRTYQIILLVLIGFTNLKCNSPNQNNVSYFNDFDIFKNKGIDKLSKRDIYDRQVKKSTGYVLKYNELGIDSIIVLNPYKDNYDMKLSVSTKDSISVYETTYPYWKDMSYKCYYVVKPNELAMYLEIEDGWDVRIITNKISYKQLKIVLSDADTLNFKQNLLNNRPPKFRDMPAHNLESNSIRLTKDFTFNKWLSYFKP
ncbi:hypothetical protein NAF17_11295 [Mucilaginibacter sp. RB4R14]|uniref:hypothetical protein n=1 Tax=Mucilaginibacter aurantiaciroseus TaxID=2949308 RepID=UPI002091683A|nr:hypothetical protein [Mucilaginibacter aurantiaciroseus]MCO5936124.1 hypothetical protein [Mucilaginibacter aurantiaciroseus]